MRKMRLQGNQSNPIFDPEVSVEPIADEDIETLINHGGNTLISMQERPQQNKEVDLLLDLLITGINRSGLDHLFAQTISSTSDPSHFHIYKST